MDSPHPSSVGMFDQGMAIVFKTFGVRGPGIHKYMEAGVLGCVSLDQPVNWAAMPVYSKTRGVRSIAEVVSVWSYGK